MWAVFTLRVDVRCDAVHSSCSSGVETVPPRFDRQERPAMRKSHTRRGAALAVMALVLGTTAACSGEESEATQAQLGKDDVLTITTFSDFGYDKLIEQWNADPERPFTVKMTKIADWDPWKQTMTQALQAGHGLTDVVAIEGDAMPQFLADGASEQFVDISD